MKALPKVYLPKPQNTPPAEGRLIDANQNTLNDNFLRLITELNSLDGGGVNPAVIAQLQSDVTVLQNGVAVLQSDLTAAKADLETAKGDIVRPNLLDNWYFLGSGSQGGGAQFPINQRGNTSYTGQKWTIDRWYASNANSSVVLTNGHLAIGASGGSIANNYGIAYQSVENPARLAGKKVTLSVLTASPAPSHPFSFTIHTIDSNNTGHWTGLGINDPQANTLYSKTVTVPDDVTWMDLHFYAGAEFASGDKIHLAAVKLEIGAEQTLAYYDGSNWKLRELPEYTEQLSRCQRYFYRINRPVATTNTIALAHAYSTSAAVAVLPVPHMRAITSVTTSNTFRIINNNGTTLNVSSYSPKNSDGGVECSIDITAASASLTKGNLYILVTNGAGYMDFNANL